MLSLPERFDLLKRDLLAQPMRISAHSDLPFAILRYDPDEEWDMRRHARSLETHLAHAGRAVMRLSLADLLWEAIDATEGMEAITAAERDYGFTYAQDAVTTILSEPLLRPLPETVAARMNALDPERAIVFLMRAAALSPNIYQMSRLLDELQGQTRVPAILFYPGTIEGVVGLRFMGTPQREALGNYRVKVYA